MPMHWQTSRFLMDLQRPLIMGIVNNTPDSFSDGGRHRDLEAVRHAEKLIRDGADILDIGGESTRPGSPAVPQDEEMRRVLPVVQEAVKLGVPISVDTYKPAVMQAVLDAGADIVNDIWGLRQPGAQDVVARHPSCGVCLMHMHQTPQNMHLDHMSGDPVPQVRDFLLHETQSLLQRGVQRNRIVWDYGIGFGKSVAQNFALLARQHELLELDFPLLAGWSRKGSLGMVSGLPVEQRMVPSVAAALLAVERGARVVRVHDVADTRAALSVWQAMQPPATSA
ncbi:dihydropteroate synthase [Comamonas aquatica]|uniref:Dihydropteroate synthase n=1 Tax=Comamonas aquatica TaxID=225991 RepID=A0AA42VZY2_9BURK|nr:dihydropteroate synthase [Comamonas aquatica]MDH1429350.1 dihydropteroate synthase [Comamonas aquatica]MDH1604756.1 dihydropteroate synthase [Comamonas aquatica]MDH1617125.1 dihydropteroate synthase [Comamonas aquatica]MDH1673663.1 dihydropteroate synthase [Comamonas aquatica]MDH1676864.1 dihydropteroate synthase [Comamonas aquatica]